MRPFVFSLLIASSLCGSVFAQQPEVRKNKKEGGFSFTINKEIGNTDVSNQASSSTCWSFSTLSFFESEMMRMGKKPVNLSEMFVVRNIYQEKADRYVRMHGNLAFAPGGAFHDPIHVLKAYGMMPEEAYMGKLPMEKDHKHGELDAVTLAFVKAVVENHNKRLSPVWKDAFSGILDAYLGKLPSTFTYDGKTYTPKSFGESLGLNANDYVEIGSYTHHPFYEKFILEVPDNWMQSEIQNLPLDEMMEVLDNAIANGFTVAWGADVSEPYFSHENAVAVVPATEWRELSKDERAHFFEQPRKEATVTQEMRQAGFDNYATEDDHGMHIVGTAKDQAGTKYYIVKNSWGKESNESGGYFYASEAYIRYKTIDFMVHKDALPKKIAKKIGVN